MQSASDNIFFKSIDVSYNTLEDTLKGDFRLDSGYYTNSDSIIHNIQTEPLSFFCSNVFMGPIFKRIEVTNKQYGVRFFASNEIVSLSPSITYLDIDQANKLNLIVKKGMILITGYGTIGSVRIVDSTIDGFAIADNVTRIIPKNNLGYIACFLSSKYGHQLLNDYASGSTIKFIQAPQIAKIPVPILDSINVNNINDLYLKAVSCREKSFSILKDAHFLILEYNNLPSISEFEIETLDPNKEAQIRFTNLNEFTTDLRLDSHFYNPIAKIADENIQRNSNRYMKLKDLTSEIVIGKRFKRNYVESGHGTPFIGSKNIIQIRPTELKYLSNSEIGFMSDLMLNKNMILIACSGSLGGTFGKACFVYKNFENYAASQHILRVIANESLIDPGYLYAFLSSEYGYECITRYRWGALIDEIDNEDMSKLIIPLPKEIQQKEIGDLVRQAFDFRADAIRFENEAQDLLTSALNNAKTIS